MAELTRCPWSTKDPLYIAYHDEEWGRPNRDGRRLFEKIILEGAQAGLSWITILKKRENYRRLFEGFDPAKVAAFDDDDVARLLGDAGIIRNQAKIRSAINNAKVFVDNFGMTGREMSEILVKARDLRTLDSIQPLLKMEKAAILKHFAGVSPSLVGVMRSV